MIALKRLRRIAIGPIVTVVFENRTTVRFQVQEMARAERLVTDDEILHELEVYNPLIPAPGELSMTLFVELTSEAQLREWLPKLVGIERDVVLRIGEGDEARDCPSRGRRCSRRHSSRGTRRRRRCTTCGSGSRDEQRRSFVSQHVEIGVEHPNYRHHTELPVKTKVSLAEDWNDE